MPTGTSLKVLSDGPVDYYSLQRCPSERPCSKIDCRYHLAVGWKGRGGKTKPKLTFPDVELDDLPETCALDVAQKYDGLTLAQVGLLLNVTQERVRQIEFKALRKIRSDMEDIVKYLGL